jgi:hypothetical protein
VSEPPVFECIHGAPVWETLEMLSTRERITRSFCYVYRYQSSISQSLALRERGELRAVLHFVPDQTGLPVVEMCAFFGATPPRHLLPLIRQTQLTLGQLHENGIAPIMWVRRSDRGQGHRLAKLVGFTKEHSEPGYGTLYRWEPT